MAPSAALRRLQPAAISEYRGWASQYTPSPRVRDMSTEVGARNTLPPRVRDMIMGLTMPLATPRSPPHPASAACSRTPALRGPTLTTFTEHGRVVQCVSRVYAINFQCGQPLETCAPRMGASRVGPRLSEVGDTWPVAGTTQRCLPRGMCGEATTRGVAPRGLVGWLEDDQSPCMHLGWSRRHEACA